MNAPLVVSGLVVLAAAWLGPLPELAQRSFAAHMILHVSVVAVAAPLIGVGIAGSGLLQQRALLLCAPIPASLLEFLVIWGWHAPHLHHLARSSFAVFAAEQASFLAAGLLLWASSFHRTPESSGGGVLALLLTSMHMILLGTLLTLAPRALYRHAEIAGTMTPLTDQQLGGLLMLLGGGLPYLAGGLYLVWLLLQPAQDVARGSGRSPGTPG